MDVGMPAGKTVATLAHLTALVAKVPEGCLRPVFAAFGLLAGRVWHAERARLRETLDRIHHRLHRHPTRSFDAILDDMFVHLALTALELVRLPKFTPEAATARFQFLGLEYLQAALAGGRGAILVVPHLGNWELLGAAIVRAGFPLHSFYLAQKDDSVGGFLDYLRGFSGIVLHDRDRGGIGGLRALRSNAVLGMIADQDGGNQGVYLDFLGHWVSMPAGPANWSLKTGAALLPLYSLRVRRSTRFIATFLPALPAEAESDHVSRVVVRTKRLVSWMENLILDHPEQYLWLYDRFRPRHEKYLGPRLRQGLRRCHGESAYPL